MADETLDFEVRLLDQFSTTGKQMSKILEGIDKRLMGIQKNTALQKLDKDAKRATNSVNSLAIRGDKLISLSANLNLASNSMLRLGRTAAGIFLAPIKESATFEASMSKVRAVTSDFTEDQRELARVLGRDTKFTADEAAQGMSSLAIAGFSAKEQMQSLGKVLSLDAAAGMDNLGNTASIASRTLRGFGLDASEMGRVADVLTATFTNSNTTLTTLGETFKFVAPVARAAGVSLEETAKLAGILGDAGIDASMAGTSMRLVMLRLAGTTPQANKALKELGITTVDTDGNLRGVSNILVDVGKQLAGLGSAAKLKRTTQLFGRLGVTAGTVLIDQLTNSGVSANKMTNALNNLDGAADRTARTMEDNLTGDVTKMESAFSSLLITIGDQFTPMLRELATTITGDVLKPLEKWSKENKELVVNMGIGLAAIAATATALGGLGIAASSVALVFGSVLKGAAIVKTIFTPIIIGISKIIRVVRILSFIFTPIIAGIAKGAALAAVAFVSLPVVILGALAAVGVGMFVWFDDIRKFMESVGSAFFDFGQILAQGITDGWDKMIASWNPIAGIMATINSVRGALGFGAGGPSVSGGANARPTGGGSNSTTTVGGSKTLVFSPTVTVQSNGAAPGGLQSDESVGQSVASSLLKVFDDGIAALGAG